MMYKNYGGYDTPIDYTKPKTKKQKEKIKRYEHRLKVIDKKVQRSYQKGGQALDLNKTLYPYPQF